ncbi:hypothetical protein ACHAXR_008126 [Thalassiosira sp. AJA248-18]
MRLLSICLIGSIHKSAAFSSPIGCINVLALTALTVPILGDDTCDATVTDASTGEKVCMTTKDDDSHDAIVDETNESSEETTLPTWWNYNIDELFEDHFDCGEIVYGYEQNDSGDSEDDENSSDDDDENENKKVSDAVSEAQLENIRQQWATIREKYVNEVNLVPIEIHYAKSDDDSSNDKLIEATNISKGTSAMVAPARIGDAGPYKGRGLYATEKIEKGTLVINLDNGSTGIFKEGHSWREFAVSLPRETACNFIEWSWVQTIPPQNEIDDDIRNGLTIFIAFDESNLLNSADWDGVEANIRCGHPSGSEGGEGGPCRFHYYAARDIAAGEELLINYGEFEDVSQKGWTDIGL